MSNLRWAAAAVVLVLAGALGQFWVQVTVKGLQLAHQTKIDRTIDSVRNESQQRAQTLDSRRSQLLIDLSGLTADIGGLDQELQRLSQLNRELQESRKNLSDQLSTPTNSQGTIRSSSEVNRLTREIGNAEIEAASNASDLVNSRNRVSQLRSQLEAARNRLDELNAERQRWHRQYLENQDASNRDRENRRNQATTEGARVNGLILTQQTTVEDITKQIEVERQREQQLLSLRLQKSESLSRLRSLLATAEATALAEGRAAIQGQLERIDANIASNIDRIAKIRVELTGLAGRREAVQSELKTLSEKITASSKEINDQIARAEEFPPDHIGNEIKIFVEPLLLSLMLFGLGMFGGLVNAIWIRKEIQGHVLLGGALAVGLMLASDKNGTTPIWIGYFGAQIGDVKEAADIKRAIGLALMIGLFGGLIYQAIAETMPKIMEAWQRLADSWNRRPNDPPNEPPKPKDLE